MMPTRYAGDDGSAGARAVRSFEAVCKSARCAMLTDAQAAILESLRTDVRQLFARGRDADARRTIKLAVSMIAAGPPALE